jgi:hypothetical protein
MKPNHVTPSSTNLTLEAYRSAAGNAGDSSQPASVQGGVLSDATSASSSLAAAPASTGTGTGTATTSPTASSTAKSGGSLTKGSTSVRIFGGLFAALIGVVV